MQRITYHTTGKSGAYRVMTDRRLESNNLHDLTEDKLAVAALSENASAHALECLYRRYKKYHYPSLAAWIFQRWRIGGDDLDDIFQDLFSDFKRAFNRYDPKRGHFYSYFMQTVFYRCLRLKTLRKRQIRRDFTESRHPGGARSEERDTPNDGMVHLFLEECLSALPLKYRIVLTKRYLEGYTVEEISRALNISTRSVRRWERYGTHFLRKCVMTRMKHMKVIEDET
jgi:RNA polymerase sigma factor (sigma-70 family)